MIRSGAGHRIGGVRPETNAYLSADGMEWRVPLTARSGQRRSVEMAGGRIRLAVRKVTALALSFDHRITDSEPGSLFLPDVNVMLVDPLRMLVWGGETKEGPDRIDPGPPSFVSSVSQ
ncbi:2-oxo acid dehydrogenase subunit E2 [Nonomuraea sp. NPDC050691]|uniref:2-oxo acid dehydrogenase subunit E2 n=1 Tax=Nonomuraea sp. NPDC050691 TaxID=3155661 RepID=UPI0033F2720A